MNTPLTDQLIKSVERQPWKPACTMIAEHAKQLEAIRSKLEFDFIHLAEECQRYRTALEKVFTTTTDPDVQDICEDALAVED